MATTDLTFSTIGGGSLEESFQQALATIAGNMEDPDLVGQKRTLKLEITFQPKGDYVHTSTKVTTNLPTKAGTGIAWLSGSKLVTETRARDSRQLDLEAEIDEVTAARAAREAGED